MKVNGFTLCTGKENIFVATERQNITDNAALEFVNRYQCAKNRFAEINNTVIQWTKKRMIKATYELVTTANGYKYHKIEYDNGITCAPLDDKTTVIVL